MYPHGTIYDSSELRSNDFENGVILHKYRAVDLHPKPMARVGYFVGRTLGASLVSFAVLAVLFAFGPIVKQEISYRANPPKIAESAPVLVDDTNAQDANRVQKEAEELGLDAYYSLYIPKIDAKSRVVPNVNPGNEKEYLAALKEGVAHAAGTYFPGQGKNIFLFSHSTDSPLNYAQYNAVFYLLNKLEEGDRVTVFFAGEKFEYEVEQVQTVGADATEWMTKDYGGERLILQTCTPPGTSWRRLLVIAKPL